MPRTIAYLSFVLMMSLVVLTSGCKTKKPRPAATDGEVLPGADTEYAMPERFEDGERITDVAFENVLFGYNQYDITGAEVAKIEAVASYLQQSTDVRLIAEGNCDERGSREYNVSLGENRAQAVRAYLISLGIDGARVQTKSNGEEMPLDAGHGEAAWAINRRVEFALYR